MVPGPYRFSHGRRQSNKEHRKEVIVGANALWKGLFELAHENARLETLRV